MLGRFLNPYHALPEHRFWRKAIANVPLFAVDPMTQVPFKIGSTDRVATAGSCFAQRIARGLQGSGFHYFVAEKGPEHLSPEAAYEQGYGVYSARYGNLYTTLQLVQLFDRAYGHFKPRLEYWQRPNGRYVDPFRPEAVPGGFATSEAVIADRDAHFAAVRRVFEQLEVFVFTFGLTEGWLVKDDGAALQLAPGVSGGEFDTEKYLFRNARPHEVVAEFIGFIDRLRSVNAKSKVIVSVSPVPMIATYESRHILVSNSYTKSALRCAADEIASARPNISYFPSYEMVTGLANGAQYYAADQRTITDTGVRAVIKLFLDHYTERSDPHPPLGIDTRRESAKAAEPGGNGEAIHNVLRGAPMSAGAAPVSERGPVYSKKFDISGDHKIAIAGTSFARHLTRHLKANGYNVLDVEPPPLQLPEPLHRKYGFSLYSARYGDISTVHQLLQLAKEAAGEFRPADICWQRSGKFYDALRPTVEPDGLDSEEELYRHRKYHVRQVHELLHSMDILVFTLGLTDAWIHKSSGMVYPTAPGVLAGELDELETRLCKLRILRNSKCIRTACASAQFDQERRLTSEDTSNRIS